MKNNAAEKIRSCLEDLFRDKKTLIKILSIILILLIAAVFRMHSSAAVETAAEDADIEVTEAGSETTADDETGGSQNISEELYVDIGGAVKKPGVYKVGPDTRLYEVVEMAGGLSDDADTNSVNQAAFVEDGQKIIIPVRSGGGKGDDADDTGHPAGTAQADNASQQSAEGFVNINTAGKEELMTLNGIGDVLADRIIEYRKSNIFSKKEDIMSVNGIGTSKFDKIKDQIII